MSTTNPSTSTRFSTARSDDGVEHVEPDWLRAEIVRQSDGVMDAMTSAAQHDDIARYVGGTGIRAEAGGDDGARDAWLDQYMRRNRENAGSQSVT